MPPEAGVLRGFAEEESAKALILINAVRCPRHRAPAKLGAIVGWFYSHLARLIYAESFQFPPLNVQQLQEAVDLRRKEYVQEGIEGEEILPNQHLFQRESLLCTDVVVGELGEPSWNDPLAIGQSPDSAATGESPLPSLQLVEAMSKLGILSLPGRKLTSEVWGKVNFAGPRDRSDATELVREVVKRLVREYLPTEASVDPYVQTLLGFWQLPMYNPAFKKTPGSVNGIDLVAEAH